MNSPFHAAAPPPFSKMKLQFRHTFTSRHPVIATFRGKTKAPKIEWPRGFPPSQVLHTEYPEWILSVMQTASNRYKTRILYYMPSLEGVVLVTFEPQNSSKEQAPLTK